MRRSFVRLVIGSVLTFWLAAFVVIFLYSRGLSWTDEKARKDGIFLAFELLDQAPAADRVRRLGELRQHFSVDLSLLTTSEVERRVGRPVTAGEQVPREVSVKEEWYYLVFEDGQGALAAGPVNPTRPTGYLPIGVILLIVSLPLVAGLLALRVERRLKRVEHASDALGRGDLSARVASPGGLSDELAARFNAMAERVEQLVRSRDELVQAVSHELGSPLSRLRFHMELLDRQSNERFEDRLAAMTRDLDALDELVSELLSYVQSDATEVDRSLFDPAVYLGDLVELARLDAPEARTVDIDLDVAVGVSVHADPRLFQRAVENVLRNAVRHAAGKVRLELTKTEGHVGVTVHDDGPGIPEDLREKVTTPFFRVDSARGRRTGGAGLGLAIVSRIMRQHGGRLDIDASPLGGASVATLWPNHGPGLLNVPD